MMKRLGKVFLILFSAWFCIEGTSTLLVWLLADSTEKNAHLLYQIRQFHPLWHQVNDDGDPTPTKKSNPNSLWTFATWTGYTNKANWSSAEEPTRTNEAGFICNAECLPLPQKKPANEFRVFFLGGSLITHNGAEKSGADTIPARVEQQVRDLATGKTIRVINAGVSGFYSVQEMNRLVNQVLYYDPDFLIVLDGPVDFVELMYDVSYPYADRYKNYIFPSHHRYDYAILESLDRLQTLQGSLAHTFNMANQYFPVFYYTATLIKHVRTLLMSRGTNQASGADNSTSKLTPEQIDALIHNDRYPSLRSFALSLDVGEGVARQRKIPLVWFLAPNLRDQSKKKLAGREIEMMADLKKAGDILPIFKAYYDGARSIFHAKEKRVDGAVRFIDLTGIFDNSESQIYTDQSHFNQVGIDAVSDAIVSTVKPLLVSAVNKH